MHACTEATALASLGVCSDKRHLQIVCPCRNIHQVCPPAHIILYFSLLRARAWTLHMKARRVN